MVASVIRKPTERNYFPNSEDIARPSASDFNSNNEGVHCQIASQVLNSPLIVGSNFQVVGAQNCGGSRLIPLPHDLESSFIDEGAHAQNVTPTALSPLIGEIVQLVRMRRRWLRAKNSLILQSKAICRMWTSGDKHQADALYKSAVKDTDGVDMSVTVALMPFLAAIERFESELKPIERRLEKIACELPVYQWASTVRGFGKLNLAMLVGEAGDIGSYRNPSCLWKRFGLGVFDGKRQRRTTDKELAIAMGYSPERRSTAYLLGDCLVKGNKTGAYRSLYLERKELEATRVATKKHAHDRAARYMIKRVLVDLWVAWRAVEVCKPCA